MNNSLTVNVWLKSATNEVQLNALSSFSNNPPEGLVVSLEDGSDYSFGANVDVVFGSWKNSDAPHHNLKNQVVKHSRNILVLETPLINRGPVTEAYSGNWFRAGFGGFMADCEFIELTPDRAVLERKFALSPNYKRGDYIYVILQNPGDASLRGVDISSWCEFIIKEIRQFSDRKIVVRKPQLQRNYSINRDFLNENNAVIMDGTYANKEFTFLTAYAVFCYSSAFGVEALMRGIPVYYQSLYSFSQDFPSIKDVLDFDYVPFSSQKKFDKWLKTIQKTEWNIQEIKSGKLLKDALKQKGFIK